MRRGSNEIESCNVRNLRHYIGHPKTLSTSRNANVCHIFIAYRLLKERSCLFSMHLDNNEKEMCI